MKVRVGRRWRVVSEKTGRNLGTYKTETEANTRLRQVEYFKSRGKKKKGKKRAPKS